MKEVLEVSYTGDLLAHRRCPRAWAFERYARFHPYEQVQAMEGRLVHHAMEWMTQQFAQSSGKHVSLNELKDQLLRHFRVLHARGVRTAFQSKDKTIKRVLNNLFPSGHMHPTVKVAIEGASHTEYELRAVKKLIKAKFAGKDRLMLTGILDLVLQSQNPLTYARTWVWKDKKKLLGSTSKTKTIPKPNDLEVWDYKGTKAKTPHLRDYVLQLLTYASLYGERSGDLPKRCVLFFVNEQKKDEQLVAIEIDEDLVQKAEKWTIDEARRVRQTSIQFEQDPNKILGGDLDSEK